MNHIDVMQQAFDVLESMPYHGPDTATTIDALRAAIAQGESEPLTSFDAEFMAALNGSKGDLDAWLECNNEAEVRSFMKRAIERGVK